jgi:hypothetical protein
MGDDDPSPSSADQASSKPRKLSAHRFKYKLVKVADYKEPGDFIRNMNYFGYRGWRIIDLTRSREGKVAEVIFMRTQEISPQSPHDASDESLDDVTEGKDSDAPEEQAA